MIRSKPALAAALAASAGGAIAAAFFFVGGDPCKSSGRGVFLYLSPVLFGVAGSIGAAQRGKPALTALVGVLVAALCFCLLVFAALLQWGSGCYT